MAQQALVGLHHYRGFTTFGRTPLSEWLALCRDLYLTTHTNPKRHTSMHPAGFDPTVAASKRPQTQTLDRAATGISILNTILWYRSKILLTKARPKNTSRCKFSPNCQSFWQTECIGGPHDYGYVSHLHEHGDRILLNESANVHDLQYNIRLRLVEQRTELYMYQRSSSIRHIKEHVTPQAQTEVCNTNTPIR